MSTAQARDIDNTILKDLVGLCLFDSIPDKVLLLNSTWICERQPNKSRNDATMLASQTRGLAYDLTVGRCRLGP